MVGLLELLNMRQLQVQKALKLMSTIPTSHLDTSRILLADDKILGEMNYFFQAL